MHLVSQNSEAELVAREALEKVQWCLRTLAANLMRIARGAGRPEETGYQASDFVQAVAAYREAAGHYPLPDALSQCLDYRYATELMDKLNEQNQLIEQAEEKIVGGALQIAASRLLKQRTQERAGDSEMHEGIRDLEQAIAKPRQREGRQPPASAMGSAKTLRAREREQKARERES